MVNKSHIRHDQVVQTEIQTIYQ